MAGKAVFPGTFDPITNGHVDLIERATALFDELIVAIAASTRKKPYFSLAERVDMTAKVFAKNSKIKVESFDCLLIDFVQQREARVIIRGLRAVADFEYEFQLAAMNKKLAPQVESLFLTPAEQYACLSSSLVREIVAFGGDITPFVPTVVAKALLNNA